MYLVEIPRIYSDQNRRQEVFNRRALQICRGGFSFVRGAWYYKIN